MNINCPNCQEALEIGEDYIGRKGQCPYCQHKFIIEAPIHDLPPKPIHKKGFTIANPSPNYWRLFKDAPLSVKVSTCELILLMLLGCKDSFVGVYSAVSKGSVQAILIDLFCFLFVFVLFLIFITRHLKGQNWVRIVVSVVLAIPLLIHFHWASALVIAFLGVPFWMPSANAWVSSQRHRSNV